YRAVDREGDADRDHHGHEHAQPEQQADAHRERPAFKPPRARIDGTQRPTKMPCSWLPVNQRLTERTNDTNAPSRTNPFPTASNRFAAGATCALSMSPPCTELIQN